MRTPQFCKSADPACEHKKVQCTKQCKANSRDSAQCKTLAETLHKDFSRDLHTALAETLHWGCAGVALLGKGEEGGGGPPCTLGSDISL